jgi:hypothetical protein
MRCIITIDVLRREKRMAIESRLKGMAAYTSKPPKNPTGIKDQEVQ